jgi:hypothetical protein
VAEIKLEWRTGSGWQWRGRYILPRWPLTELPEWTIWNERLAPFTYCVAACFSSSGKKSPNALCWFSLVFDLGLKVMKLVAANQNLIGLFQCIPFLRPTDPIQTASFF